jgi:hypothetical protein
LPVEAQPTINMLYLLLVYFFISLVCYCGGVLFYNIFSLDDDHRRSSQKPLINYLITGLVFVTGIGQWIVLFFPLNFFSLFSVTLSFIALSLFYRKKIFIHFKNISLFFKQNDSLFLLCFLSLLFMILTLNAGPTIMDDTDSYHIQMIKWAQEYGTVPGLANLHLRYGFNSSWFISIGLLSQKLKGLNPYLVLNGLLSVWICHYLLEKVFFVFSKKSTEELSDVAAPSFLLLICGLIIWPMIRGNAATTNYDFIATCCIIVMFVETISSPNQDCRQEWIIWPVYLFTVRIINFPILFLTLLSLARLLKKQEIKQLAVYGTAILFLTIPFIIRNTVLSGYPFFPIYQADLFSFDWKADRQQTMRIVNFIKYFNRVNVHNQPLAVTMKLHFPDWVISWYRFLFVYDKVFITISLFSYLIILATWKKVKKYFNQDSTFFLIGMLLQLMLWFIIAPDPRFVYGPLLCGIFSLSLIVFSSYHTQLYSKFMRIALAIMMIAVFLYAIKKIETDNNYNNNWISPRGLPVPPVKKIVIDGIELKIPEKVLNNWNPRCYDLALPCLYEVDPRLRARGKTISQGFRLEK